MKTVNLLAAMLLLAYACAAQVSWQYDAKPIAANKYKITITATLAKGWHLYAQKQPKDAIAIPTKITFLPNPLIVFNGKIMEDGKMQTVKMGSIGISDNRYSDKVIFSQEIQLKVKAKTNLSGNVSYQICTDERCLPQTVEKFNIMLGG